MSYEIFKFKEPPVVFFPPASSRQDRIEYIREHVDEYFAHLRQTNENLSNLIHLKEVVYNQYLTEAERSEIWKLIQEHEARAANITKNCMMNYEKDRETYNANHRADSTEGKADSTKDSQSQNASGRNATPFASSIRGVISTIAGVNTGLR